MTTTNKYQIYREPVSDIVDYLLIVAQFVTDPKMDPNQDLDFFRELVFDSKYGYLHGRFCRYFLVKNKDYNFAFEAVSNFLEFLYKNNNLFTYDFFNTLCIDHSSEIIEKLFFSLPTYLKQQALEVFTKHDKVIKKIPRIKTYIIFS